MEEKRSQLSTSMNGEILEKFKEACKARGFKMNTVLELFMQQFVNEEFVLKIKKVDPTEKQSKPVDEFDDNPADYIGSVDIGGDFLIDENEN